MWPLSDEALVAGFAAGDSDAATAFVRRHQARVFGLAVTMVGDPAVAEEIAQEAFTRAWRHAESYDTRRGKVSTWLLTITRNLAIDHLRAHRTEPLDPGAIQHAEEALWISAGSRSAPSMMPRVAMRCGVCAGSRERESQCRSRSNSARALSEKQLLSQPW